MQQRADAASSIGHIPTLPTLDQLRDMPCWYDLVPANHLLGLGVPSADEPRVRMLAIDMFGGKHLVGVGHNEARARAKYKQQHQRNKPGPAEAAWYQSRGLWVEGQLSVYVGFFPAVPVTELRAALYTRYEDQSPKPAGYDSANVYESPEQRVARLERWVMEGRQVAWQLENPGKDRETAKRDAAEMKLIAKRLRQQERDAERVAKAQLAIAERTVKATVPGTEAHRNARGARVRAEGQMRYNKSLVERIIEDEVAITVQGVVRPTPSRPTSTAPLVTRPGWLHNRTSRWVD